MYVMNILFDNAYFKPWAIDLEGHIKGKNIG